MIAVARDRALKIDAQVLHADKNKASELEAVGSSQRCTEDGRWGGFQLSFSITIRAAGASFSTDVTRRQIRV